MSQVNVTVENEIEQIEVTAQAVTAQILVTVSPEEAAKIYAIQAAASAAAALASEQAAELAETNAETAETNAETAATTATTQAGIASTQAGISTTQAGIATTQAGLASASQQSAALSAQSAYNSELAAATQAGIATTQAGIATTQAGNALTSANNALNSANAAAASAASAAQVGTSTLLTGFTTGANTTILATDTTLQAFQKAQGQINARVSGTGTSGQVAFWSGTSSQTGDSGLFWDNTNKRLGVGTNAPSQRLHIFDSAGLANNTFLMTSAVGRANIISFQNTTLTTQGAIISTGSSWAFGTYLQNQLNIAGGSGGVGIRVSSPQNINFYAGNADADFSQNVFRLFGGTGNVLIQNGGTFTDAGFRLDVNGTARVQGALTVGNGTDSTIIVRSASVASESAGNFNTISLIPETTNNSIIFDVRPSGTNTNLTGFVLRDSSTAATGSNQIFFGRGNITLPSTSVAYFGALVTAQASGNSFHLGFVVSNSSLNRFEPMRIWNSGNVYIQKGGTYTDVASAILNVNSTTQGFLPPRMTSAQRNAIASPATGLMVYNTTDNRPSFFNGTSWINL